MGSGGGNTFTKTRTCPSSQDLSLSQHACFPSYWAAKIKDHIAGFEFGAAELRFLSAYAQPDGAYEATEIPPHLRRLAQSVLDRDLERSL